MQEKKPAPIDYEALRALDLYKHARHLTYDRQAPYGYSDAVMRNVRTLLEAAGIDVAQAMLESMQTELNHAPMTTAAAAYRVALIGTVWPLSNANLIASLWPRGVDRPINHRAKPAELGQGLDVSARPAGYRLV